MIELDSLVDGGRSGMVAKNVAVLISAVSLGSSNGSTVHLVSTDIVPGQSPALCKVASL